VRAVRRLGHDAERPDPGWVADVQDVREVSRYLQRTVPDEGIGPTPNGEHRTPRQQAQADGEPRYNGQPCKRCGGTERDTRQGNCVACHRAWQRERFRNMTGPAYGRRLLQMRRVHALRRMAERNERREVGRGPL
jgi:hypothetical protein